MVDFDQSMRDLRASIAELAEPHASQYRQLADTLQAMDMKSRRDLAAWKELARG